MKFTEGAFRDWGYEVAKEFFGAVEIDGGPWCRIPDGKPGAGLVIKDAIADITLQQVLTRPDEFDVIATLEPERRLPVRRAARRRSAASASRRAATSTTSPATPSSRPRTAPRRSTPTRTRSTPARVILSGEMMFRYLGWNEAADLIVKGMDGAIGAEARDLRLRAPDGRRDGAEDVGVRGRDHQAHVDGDRRRARRARRAHD